MQSLSMIKYIVCRINYSAHISVHCVVEENYITDYYIRKATLANPC